VDIGRKLADLEKRLARMENSPRLSHAALDNTSIVVKDDQGAVRGRIGMQEDGTIGLIAVDGPAPTAPTAPVVTSTIGGLRVVWDGTLADGTALPADFDHVAVHVSTTSGFTPSAATYVGTITKAGPGGMLPVIPLPYVPHYVRLTAVNTSGVAGDPSEETTATPIKVDGPDLKAGSVEAAAIKAGAVTAEKLEAVLQLVTRLVAGDADGARVELNEDGLRVYNDAGELMIRFDAADGSGVFTGTITGSTITGGIMQTATSGQRITLNEGNANKIIVYNASGQAIGELSARGLLVKGSGGAVMHLDPNATYPYLKLTNAALTNAAIINVVETTTGAADLGLNTGTFTGSGFTDMKWRTFSGNDFAVIERIRDADDQYYVGGRLDLRSGQAQLGYYDKSGATQRADITLTPGVLFARARASIQPDVGDANTVLTLRPGTSHTGPILRYYDPDASLYRFVLDKAGNVDINGILTAGNIAAGRVTITPTAANTPTSFNVTGLNLKGTNIRVTATPGTSLPGTQVTGVGVTNVSSTGFTLWLTRTNTTSTGIDWIAFGV
jgi:hypothetical protein